VQFVRKYDTTANQPGDVSDIAIDSQGNLYFTDSQNNQVHKYDKDGNFVTKWGKEGKGDGEFEFRPAPGTGDPNAGFLVVDKQGAVYVSDGYNFRIQKFDANGKFLSKWGSQGSGEGQFVPPTVGPLALDNSGNLYVSDFGHVQKFDSSGKFLAKFGSPGSGDGQFIGAAARVIDKQGNIYVADLRNIRIQKIDSKGNFIAKFGSPGVKDGQFSAPVGIAMDSKGKVYVADNSSRIQIFDSDGKYLAEWDAPGNGDARFRSISSIAIDDNDNIYLADSPTGRVYQFRPKS
jgi:DNA-binding beta-propeller fold protein YncE